MLRRERQLTKPERAVWDAIESGALVELPLGAPAAADPTSGQTWGKDRQIRAELLHELLVGGRKGVRPRALRLAGARITGTLDLEAATLVCPLSLHRCSFEQTINLQEAQAPAVRLHGCRAPGLQGEQLQTRGNLELIGLAADGEVRLPGAHIGGRLDCTGATFANPKGRALNADGLTVDQDMLCRSGFTAQGEVRLNGAHIGGQLNFRGASLSNPDGPALNADGLTVAQSMFCDQGFTAQGDVRLLGGHVGEQLSFRSATLTNPGRRALNADGLTVDQNMYCDQQFAAQGEVRLVSARISRELNFSGATLTNPDGFALNADGLTVGQNVLCRQGFVARGEVRLVAGHVGNLDFGGARLANPKGRALAADKLTVDLSMFCREGFTAQGEVNLVGAHIGSNLEFTDATLTNPDGYSLIGNELTVDQSMFCRQGFTSQGEVNLVAAHMDVPPDEHLKGSFIAKILDSEDEPQHNIIDSDDRFKVRFRVALQGELESGISGDWWFDLGFAPIGAGTGFDLSDLLGREKFYVKNWPGLQANCIELTVEVPKNTIPTEFVGTVYRCTSKVQLFRRGTAGVFGYHELGAFQFYKADLEE